MLGTIYSAKGTQKCPLTGSRTYLQNEELSTLLKKHKSRWTSCRVIELLGLSIFDPRLCPQIRSPLQFRPQPATMLIKDVTPDLANWTVEVVVLEKGTARDSRNSPTKFQKLTLADSTGDKIQAVIYNFDIEKLAHLLLPFLHYRVSNAAVKAVDRQYQLFGKQYQWTISRRTMIAECSGQVHRTLKMFEFTPLNKLHLSVDSEIPVDIIALVLDIKQAREVNSKGKQSLVQDIVLIDEGLQPVSLSLWDKYAENEGEQIAAAKRGTDGLVILIATRLKVVSHAGMSLGTRSNSMFMIDPDISLAVELRSWATDNMSKVNSALVSFNITPWEKRSPLFMPTIATQIADVRAKAERLSNIWVYATARIVDKQQKFHQIACNKCGHFVNTLFAVEFNCGQCRKDSITVPRAIFEVMLSDESGSIISLIEGDLAEQQFSFLATTLVQKESQGQLVIEEVLNTSIIGPKLMHLRAFDSNFRGVRQKKFRVMHVQDDLPEMDSENNKKTGKLSPALSCIAEIRFKADKLAHFWVLAKMEIVNYEQTFHGIACNKCGYFVDTLFGIEHTCIKCKKEATTTARSRFEVVVKDDSGSLRAFIEGKLAEEQFGCEAEFFLQKTIQSLNITEAAFRNTTTETMKVHLLAFDSNSNGSTQTQFRVLEVQNPTPAPGTLSSSSNALMVPEYRFGKTECEPSSSSAKRKLLFDSITRNDALGASSLPVKLDATPTKGEKESETHASDGDADTEPDSNSTSPKKKMLLDSLSDSTKLPSSMATDKACSDAEADSQG